MKNPRKLAPMAVVVAAEREIVAPGASAATAHLMTRSRHRVNRPR